MSHDVYYQFIPRPGQARRSGARGGKATARNRRQRLESTAAEAPQPEAGPAPQLSLESTAAGIAFLDAQYPRLRGAEKRPHTQLACDLLCQPFIGSAAHLPERVRYVLVGQDL
jgi:hypothetical protein